MPKFYCAELSELSHQLTLSPRRLRVAQIQGIEKLLGMIERDRAYPYELVCYIITGFRKRGPASERLFAGKALTCDLMTMAEVLSRHAKLNVTELPEEFKSHQEVADELKVSTKTVRRWRNLGLMGLRVDFPDGVNRLAFCRSTIDRFITKNGAVVAKAAAFKQLSGVERDRIVERAREIVAKRRMKMHAVAKLIADETGRAVETVRYTLRRYDEAHKEAAIFSGVAAGGLSERDASIWKAHRSGDSVATLAKAYGCDASDIEQTLRSAELCHWKLANVDYIPNELFDAPNADDLILHVAEPAGSNDPMPRAPRDLPPYLQSLYLTPLLSREQEQDLFRRFNYLKFKAARAIRKLDDELTSEQHGEVKALLGQVDALRQRLTKANLRLVVSIAKRHVGISANFFEVVSDGNMSLMRAIEKFDYALGNKFSTYASWAIMKNYARTIPEQHYHATRYVTGQDEMLEAAADTSAVVASESDRGKVKELLSAALAQLSEKEREIVAQHFGLHSEGGTTLEQLGKRYGVTKERVRQIEHRALSRLREVLAPSVADLVAE